MGAEGLKLALPPHPLHIPGTLFARYLLAWALSKLAQMSGLIVLSLLKCTPGRFPMAIEIL